MTPSQTPARAPDRRIQRTRQLLLGALLQLIQEVDYEAITVQDILDRANVGRSTFYAHFQDKEALLLSGAEALREMFAGFQPQLALDDRTWDFSLALFQHAEAQRPAFKALLGKKAGNVVLKHIQTTLAAYLKKGFQAAYPSKKAAAVPLDVFVQYFVSTFLGLFTWWLDNDFPCPAEQINAYYRRLTEPTIQRLLSGR